MQEVYQISIIPAFKPWRGFRNLYTTNVDVFNLMSESDINNLDISDIPDDLKHLCVEAVWNDETETTQPYVPNGTEDWEAETAIVNGEEICLDINGCNLIENMTTGEPDFPIIILGTTQAYTE